MKQRCLIRSSSILTVDSNFPPKSENKKKQLSYKSKRIYNIKRFKYYLYSSV